MLDWVVTVVRDLTWMWQNIQDLRHLSDPAADDSVWNHLMIVDKSLWKDLVGKYRFSVGSIGCEASG